MKTICQLLYSNLKKLYDFHLSIENIFFTYIFDQSYKSVDKKKFNAMISKCNSEDVAYILFNPDDNIPAWRSSEKLGGKLESINTVDGIKLRNYILICRKIKQIGDEKWF